MNRPLAGLRAATAPRALADSVGIANLAIMGVGMIGLVLTSRFLGVDDRGLYLTWSSWSALIGTLALLGTEAYIVVAANSITSHIPIRSLSGMFAIGVSISAVASTLVLWVESGSWMVCLGGVLASVAALSVAINSHVQLANGHHGWRFNTSRLLPPACGLATVTVGVFLLDASAQSLFLTLGLGSALGAAAAVTLVRERHPRVPHFGKKVWSFARRGAALSLLTYLLVSGDLVVVSVFGTNADVAFYGVGSAARGVVLAIGSAVGMRWFASKDTLSVASLIRSLVPAALACLGALLTAPFLVPEVLGVSFSPAVPCIQLLACAGVIASLDFFLSRYVMIRSTYLGPTLIRALGMAALIVGIAITDGNATLAALVFCGVLISVMVAQFLLLRMTRPGVAAPIPPNTAPSSSINEVPRVNE